MAEAIGLVIGVIGLVGAFKDVIDLFNNFTDSREFGRDYEILDTKIDIERTILLRWADQVNLLRSNYDQRLDEHSTQHMVAQILACIKILMSDSSKLKRLYGLVEAETQQNTAEMDRVPALSGLRMEKFKQEFEALSIRMNLRKQSTSLQRRIRWVIRDKQKFQDLVKKLAYFNTKLIQVVPIYYNTQSMTTEDIGAIQDLGELKIIVDASVDYRKATAQTTQRHIVHTCQNRILRLLWFRTMYDRKESILPAHSKTLRWALEPPRSKFQWDDLSQWLQHDSGIYWISGKAGSGKSTLMKHLFHHPKTRQFLLQWAAGDDYSLIHCFFWNLGTPEQKSQEGLSRTFLYQILSNNPSLIADVLPNMWRGLYDTETDAALPSVAETRYAFQTIALRSDIGKFCIFIDGLDEFVGNYLDGITFLKELAVNKHIKIIVSSRPIADCVNSFDSLPTLQLHHLNHDDISSYMKDVIGSHRYMQELISQHPVEGNEIMQDIVAKSSGVFLWVILACRSLVSGFSDCDRVRELRQRVDELPPELEEMFQHMLSRINKRHREQGARMLRLCHAAHQARGSHKFANVNSLSLAILNAVDINTDQIQSLTNYDKRRLCKELDGRLRSRCGGLLELQTKSSPVFLDLTDHCFCGTNQDDKTHDAQIDQVVVFMHRTVFEFLSYEKVWEFECLQAPSGFDPPTDLSLVCLYSAILSLPMYETQAVAFLRDGLQWGVQSDHRDPEGQRNIFWVMQPFLDMLSPQSIFDNLRRLSHINRHTQSHEYPHAVLILAIEAGAVNYARQHPDITKLAQSEQRPCSCLPLLYHAITLPIIDGKVLSWG